MYTTKLLTIIDDRMPRRHQVIVAVLVDFIALAAIAGSRPAPRPALVVQPAIILIATPTPAPTGTLGLAKEAAPMGAAVRVLSAPIVAPAPVVVETVAQPSSHERPSDKPGPGEH